MTATQHQGMHLTLKNESTQPAAINLLQQQERFEEFSRVYNHERPHLPRQSQDQPEFRVG